MIGTDILAVYTIVPDAHTVRIWAFPEQELFGFPREWLFFQIVQQLRDKLTSGIIHFEFHFITDTKPPFGVETGGFWTYFNPGQTFSGEPMLVPALDKLIQEWKERTGQHLSH